MAFMSIKSDSLASFAIAIVGIAVALVVLVCFLALPQSSQDTQSGVSLTSQSVGSSGETEEETASLSAGDAQNGDAPQDSSAQQEEGFRQSTVS